MCFQWKFWHRHSILWAQFPDKERYFGDVSTFSVDFLHWISWMSTVFLLSVYFIYWPRNCVACFVLHVPNFHQLWSWYDHPLPNCCILALDTLRELMVLTLDLLILVSGYTWWVKYSTSLRSLEILWLSILELWVLIFPIGYQWKCVRRHCACSVSHDLHACAGGKCGPHIWNRWLRFAYTLSNVYGCMIKINWVIHQNSV